MKVAILQSNYIPWKGYFDLINSVDVFVLYDEVQYTKNDWRNRNKIKTKNGAEWITIPVSHKSSSQKICETAITLHKWNKKHWNTLMTNYGKAAFFDELKDQLKEFYMGQNSKFLSVINHNFIQFICDYLNIETRIIDSRELNLQGDRSSRLLDACEKLNATHYLSGPSAKDYLDTALFKSQNIEVEWMEYKDYPEYNQLHPPFEHGVSILDMLFNLGKDTPKYMNSFK